MTAPRRVYDPSQPAVIPEQPAQPAARMISPAAVNRLSRDMRAALRDLLGHGEMIFAAGFYAVPGGASYCGRTIAALEKHSLVAISSPRLRHSVARLTVAGRPIVRTALAYEADALAAAQ